MCPLQNEHICVTRIKKQHYLPPEVPQSLTTLIPKATTFPTSNGMNLPVFVFYINGTI